MEKEDKNVSESILGTEDDDSMIVRLKKPIDFEGKRYEKVDLRGLHDIKAADMITVNRRLSRNGNIDVTQENTLEYALNLANVATGIPLEFFEQLPPYTAMAIRNCVAGFLYRRE